MLKERLSGARRKLECLPSNSVDILRREVGRKIYQVCSSDEFKMKIVDGVDNVEAFLENIPILGIIYRYEIGIKNIYNPRVDDSKRLRSRVKAVLYPDLEL